MCGILLAGLVLSNAFKSENMYKIVIPRHHLSYDNVDELLQDDFQLYSRIWYFYHRLILSESSEESVTTHSIFVKLANTWAAKGESEAVDVLFGYPTTTMLAEKIFNNSQLHPGVLEVLVEPIKLLAPLVKIGMIGYHNYKIFERGTAMITRFWKIQNEFIVDD